MSDVTSILGQMNPDHPESAEELLSLVYEELRRLAVSKMAQQPPGQTLQATALVHEAWLKVAGGQSSPWQNREHFFRTAAQAMRQILIDRARRHLSARHGVSTERVNVDEVEIAAPAKDETLLQLDEALNELRTASPERGAIVDLRFFAGLSEPEVAEILHLSERTVQRQWSYARAWLFARIQAKQSA